MSPSARSAASVPLHPPRVVSGAWIGRVDGCSARYHGNASAYTRHRCRCAAARADKRTREKLRAAGLAVPPFVDPVGTVRRLRALAHLGHPVAELRDALGWSPSLYANTRAGCRPGRIRREKASAVAALYTHRVTLPGTSLGEVRLARRKGWAPPWAWDGEVFCLDDPAAPDWLAASTAGHPAALRTMILDEHLAALARAAELAEAARSRLDLVRYRRPAGAS